MRVRVPVRLRWSDLDAYGHVNNIELLRLLEEARIEAFWRPAATEAGPGHPTAILDAGPGAGTTTLVAAQRVEYLRPLGYRRSPVWVELWLGEVGGASIDVCYEVREVDPDVLYARATTTVVLVDPADDRPRRLTPDERAAWLPYLGEPITFRRRATR